jgi:hypothetical protein
MLRGVALVRTNVSEERIASIIRVIRIGVLRLAQSDVNRNHQSEQNFSLMYIQFYAGSKALSWSLSRVESCASA